MLFPEEHVAPLEPLAKCTGFFDGLRGGAVLQRCASRKKAALVGGFDLAL
jgi:hypothetical protein